MDSNRYLSTARRGLLGLLCLLNLFVSAATYADAPDATTLQKLSRATVPFVPNAGQWDERAAFAAQTLAGTVFVTKAGELIYSLPGKPIADVLSPHGTSSLDKRTPTSVAPVQRTAGWTLSESFVSASGELLKAAPHGYRPQSAKVSYFIGPDETKHQRGVNTYERVNLGNVYPGINVQLRATGNNIEKIFTVAPEQNPAQIHVKLSGATKLEVNAEGELIAHTDNGPVAYTAPIAFQEDAQGNKQSIAVHYALNAAQNSYGFTLAEYDQNRPLIIDPLIKSSYLGAARSEQATALAIHPVTGDVYVVGRTESPTTTFPGVGGGAQGSFGGVQDAFVSRFSADLGRLINSSYLGAAGDDEATALAIHPATGDVYVVGNTTSPTTTFPGAVGGAQTSNGGTCFGFPCRPNEGSRDGFVSRFSADLGTLINSSYLGGTGSDFVTALAIHPASGEVYVAGYTDADFPDVGGGVQSSYGGGQYDAFVARLSADLTAIINSSYLGAGGVEQATALAIHSVTGDVYVAGNTSSPTTTFPGVSGGGQGSHGGGADAFVSRFSADLTALIKSSYLGAAGADAASALAIHPTTGDVYIAGLTNSATNTFPGVSGGAQGSYGGGFYDAFVSRFSADLTTIINSSYLGAAGVDEVRALAIHPLTGEVYVAGRTDSTATTFPGVSGGAQGSLLGVDDAFVSRFSADLTMLMKSSYLGAVEISQAYALAIHPVTGDVYVAGYTDSAANTFPGVNGGAQGSNGGANGTFDAFISRFSADLTANDTTPDAFTLRTKTNVSVNDPSIVSGPARITGIVGTVAIYVDGAPSSRYCISSDLSCACDVSGGFVSAPSTITNFQSVCVTHTSASVLDAATQTIVHIGGAVGKFLSITGTALAPCNLDMDGDGIISAPKEGLVLLRAMLGFTGAATTAGTGITATQWARVRPLINAYCGTNFLQ